MCGVAGLFYRDGRQANESALRAMLQAIHHRGPDGRGMLVESSIALGHARLAIRDLSSGGHQPQSDESRRIWVSFNGEIYNDRELRAELARDFGTVFRSTCDTEILPAGYMAWGDGLFERLEGMFAIALWDSLEKRLTLVRDGIGIKPLYYFADDRVVRFASEIKGLLADPDQSDMLSPGDLHALFGMGYVGPHRTTIDGILQVSPGTIVTFTSKHQTKHTFWGPKRRPTVTTIEEASEEFSAIWDRVVIDHLVSDVPVGVLQSGGIDSTLVSMAMSGHASSKLPLFTASFSNSSFDETPSAALVANLIGSKLHRVSIDSHEGLDEVLRQVVRSYDGQICDEASIALFLLSQRIRKHVTVALCGDGGDEFFAGYPTYRASAIADRLGHLLPTPLWRMIGTFAYNRQANVEERLPLTSLISRFTLGIATDPDHAHAYWRRLVPDFLLPKIYGPSLRPYLGVDPFSGYWQELDQAEGSLIDRCLIADQRWHLPGGLLIKTDAMSMAHSLEIRVPFLDRRIMEFSGRCAANLLLSERGEKKLLLRTVARKMGAPRAITNSPKRGFNAPLAGLLRRELRPMAESAFETNVGILEPYLDAGEVRSLWREHINATGNHAYALWPILNFAIWRNSARPFLAGDRQTLAASAGLAS